MSSTEGFVRILNSWSRQVRALSPDGRKRWCQKQSSLVPEWLYKSALQVSQLLDSHPLHTRGRHFEEVAEIGGWAMNWSKNDDTITTCNVAFISLCSWSVVTMKCSFEIPGSIWALAQILRCFFGENLGVNGLDWRIFRTIRLPEKFSIFLKAQRAP